EGESDLELNPVRFGGEVALAEEVEVATAGVEYGRAVTQDRPGDLEDGAARGFGDLDRRGARRVRVGVCEPPAVRGPGQLFDPLVRAGIDQARRRCGGVHVDGPQLLPVGRQGDQRADGSRGQFGDVSEVAERDFDR